MNDIARTVLVGSSIPQPEPSAVISSIDTNRLIEINVILVRPIYQGLTLQDYADAVIAGTKPVLDHAQFESAFGISQSDLDAVAEFAVAYGLSEKWRSASAGYIKLQGTVNCANSAFGITLETVNTGSRTYRSYQGEISVHSDIAHKILHVMGLDTYMTIVKHSRRYDPSISSQITAATVNLSPTQVAGAYKFPSGSGSGCHVGIVEVDGGYTQSDVNNSFALFGVTPPTIVDISVNGGANYGATGSASSETMLDIVCCGGVAPAATLYMYFGPTYATLADGLTAIYDTVNAAVSDTINDPSVVSVSYGFGQSYWDAITGLVAAFEATFQAGIVKGISICVASGDDGAQGRSDAAPSVGYPGGSPYCICTGGTSLQISGTTIISETVWNQGNGGTGGGITTFALPSYQTGLGLTATPYTIGPGTPQALTYRGAPDLAANSDPATGYRFYVNGRLYQYGGTSAAAPLIAGLIAIINANLSTRIGFLNSKIYTNGSAFTDITVGDNCCIGLQDTGWAATAGWDACTGMGSPIGTSIQALYQTAPTTGAAYPAYLVGARPASGQTYPRPYITV